MGCVTREVVQSTKCICTGYAYNNIYLLAAGVCINLRTCTVSSDEQTKITFLFSSSFDMSGGGVQIPKHKFKYYYISIFVFETIYFLSTAFVRMNFSCDVICHSCAPKTESAHCSWIACHTLSHTTFGCEFNSIVWWMCVNIFVSAISFGSTISWVRLFHWWDTIRRRIVHSD